MFIIDKSLSKSTSTDTHKRTSKTLPLTLHKKDDTNQINACYDEIRAKYFDTNPSTVTAVSDRQYNHQSNTNKIDDNNGSSNAAMTDIDSCRIDDLTASYHEKYLPLLSDDPLLQARKQANIKLNCMLNGYNLTSPFVHHERIFTDHHLFKFHHYHDVGKKPYECSSTEKAHRIMDSARIRPLSQSIDRLRHIPRNG
jgi:hypothetical protein